MVLNNPPAQTLHIHIHQVESLSGLGGVQIQGVHKLIVLVPAGLLAGTSLALGWLCAREHPGTGAVALCISLGLLYYGVTVDMATRGHKALVH